MNEVFGKRLQDALDIRGISQKGLAERIGVTTLIVWKYANGKALPRVDRFFEICEALNVSPDFLMGKVRGIKA